MRAWRNRRVSWWLPRPRRYGDINEFAPKLETIIDRLEAAPALLRDVTADIAFNAVSSVLAFAILSVKHMNFEEDEREWRVTHRLFDYASAYIVEKVASTGGAPQLIYQKPLVNQAGVNMPHLTLNQLLHRVIVGR